MIGAALIAALAVGFATGSITGYVLGLDAARSNSVRADIGPALRRGKRK